MICIKTHFNLNRILLLVVGLWPYQQSIFARFQTISFYSILISMVLFQLTSFLTTECTTDFIIRVLSTALFSIIMAIYYSAFMINKEIMKDLIEQLQDICNKLRDENEVAIIKKYGNDAKLFTVRFTLFTICGIFSLVCLPTLSFVINVFLNINISQPHISLYIVTEYFVDEEKYFYLILLHISTASFIGSFTILAVGLMLLAYCVHICGLFKIASYRIEQVMTINILQENNLKSEMVIHKKIVYAVDMHRKAIKFAEFLISTFNGMFFCLITVTVICLSLHLLQLFHIVSFGGNVTQFLHHIVIATTIVFIMFLCNYVGQKITDHSNLIYFTAYHIQWYIAPLHIQKLILFLLQRGSKTFYLSINGLFTGSLECFATLASAAMSYFTVIYSVQN